MIKETEILDFIGISITDNKYDKKFWTKNEGLVGFYNQKNLFFTDKYSENDLPENNKIEISINEENGKINIYGYFENKI